MHGRDYSVLDGGTGFGGGGSEASDGELGVGVVLSAPLDFLGGVLSASSGMVAQYFFSTFFSAGLLIGLGRK